MITKFDKILENNTIDVISKYIDHNYPLNKNSKWGVNNVFIELKSNGRYSLVHYKTDILYQDMKGVWWFNTQKYSNTTSKIQYQIKQLLNAKKINYKETNDGGIRDAIWNDENILTDISDKISEVILKEIKHLKPEWLNNIIVNNNTFQHIYTIQHWLLNKPEIKKENVQYNFNVVEKKLLKTFDAILNLSHTIILNEDDDIWYITLTVKIKEEYVSSYEYNLLQESKNEVKYYGTKFKRNTWRTATG
jgi:hypothetical protein